VIAGPAPRRLATRHRIEVSRPNSLLPHSADGEPAFLEVWDLIPIGSDWRARIELDIDGGLFLKGSRIPMLARPQHWMRRFDLRREFAALARLSRLGLPIPEPFALGVESRWGIPRRAFLLERRISGGMDLDRVLRGSELSERDRMAAAVAAGALVRRLHCAGLYHGDLACRNLLVRTSPNGTEAFAIDLPRLVAARRASSWRRRKDLLRLAKTARRCGARDTELVALLEAATGANPAHLLRASRQTGRIRIRPIRKLRIWIWRAIGR